MKETKEEKQKRIAQDIIHLCQADMVFSMFMSQLEHEIKITGKTTQAQTDELNKQMNLARQRICARKDN